MHVIGQTYCVGPFGVELTELCCKCKLASDHFQDQPQLIELNRGVCSFRNKTDRELPCNEPTSSRGTPLATPCLPHWQQFPLREYWCPLKHVSMSLEAIALTKSLVQGQRAKGLSPEQTANPALQADLASRTASQIARKLDVQRCPWAL